MSPADLAAKEQSKILNSKPEKTPSSQMITRDPFPASKKIYVQGSNPSIQVAMREISIQDQPATLPVYDTSGAYTDPNINIDLDKGLDPIRLRWILERGNVEMIKQIASEYGQQRLDNKGLDLIRFKRLRQPLSAKTGTNVSQMHYARKGMITPEMEYIAIRENQRIESLKEQLNRSYNLLSQQHA